MTRLTDCRPRIGTVHLRALCELCGRPIAATPWRNGKHSRWSHIETELYSCGDLEEARQLELGRTGAETLQGVENSADLYAGNIGDGPEFELLRQDLELGESELGE